METTDTEMQSGFDVCPSCKSDAWKSARMVVMEGTTNTKGRLDGKTTDPGTFSGEMRNFLLSDRWFSFDHPIEAELGLTSITGLVEEIKRLMVAHGSTIQIPVPPTEPPKIGIFERIRPVEPKEPIAPPVPWPVRPEDKPWYKHFFGSLITLGIAAIVIGIVLAFFIGYVALPVALLVFVTGTPIELLRSFRANTRLRKEYDEKMRRHPSQVSEAADKYLRDCEQYREDWKSYEMQRDKANLQKREEEQAIAVYKKQLAKYEIDKMNAMTAREVLWERARVCMRCGTAYLA